MKGPVSVSRAATEPEPRHLLPALSMLSTPQYVPPLKLPFTEADIFSQEDWESDARVASSTRSVSINEGTPDQYIGIGDTFLNEETDIGDAADSGVSVQ